jgi:DedD protein
MTESPSQSSSSVDVLRRRARRRLVGAALLALIAAIALPLMFEKEPPPLADEVDIRIPNVDKTPFEPKPISGLPGATKDAPKAAIGATAGSVEATKPVTVAPAAVVAATAAVAAASALVPEKTTPLVAPSAPPKTAEKKEEIVKPTPQIVEAKPLEKAAEKKAEPAKPAEAEKVAAKSETKPEATPTDADGPKTEPVTGDYVVQLIAVRDSNSALKALARARGLGYKTAYREKLDVSNGTVTRVRVGPYKEKAFAEKIRNKLATQEFEAVVVQVK